MRQHRSMLVTFVLACTAAFGLDVVIEDGSDPELSNWGMRACAKNRDGKGQGDLSAVCLNPPWG